MRAVAYRRGEVDLRLIGVEAETAGRFHELKDPRVRRDRVNARMGNGAGDIGVMSRRRRSRLLIGRRLKPQGGPRGCRRRFVLPASPENLHRGAGAAYAEYGSGDAQRNFRPILHRRLPFRLFLKNLPLQRPAVGGGHFHVDERSDHAFGAFEKDHFIGRIPPL